MLRASATACLLSACVGFSAKAFRETNLRNAEKRADGVVNKDLMAQCGLRKTSVYRLLS